MINSRSALLFVVSIGVAALADAQLRDVGPVDQQRKSALLNSIALSNCVCSNGEYCRSYPLPERIPGAVSPAPKTNPGGIDPRFALDGGGEGGSGRLPGGPPLPPPKLICPKGKVCAEHPAPERIPIDVSPAPKTNPGGIDPRFALDGGGEGGSGRLPGGPPPPPPKLICPKGKVCAEHPAPERIPIDVSPAPKTNPGGIDPRFALDGGGERGTGRLSAGPPPPKCVCSNGQICGT
jgi:hypothetical protein